MNKRNWTYSYKNRVMNKGNGTYSYRNKVMNKKWIREMELIHTIIK